MDGDEVDSEEEMEPECSGMEQPPLTRMLRNILSEYPDDGQILKELIQNAEDARASEIKILFDCRHVNQEVVNERKRPYHKYFKGQALFFHNNARFSEDDWRGIKMLYSSVKELDPLKVGRFGLGFKSVFHITDYPMIVSGGKLLIIDPYKRNSDTVCQSFVIQKLNKYKGMEIQDCKNAFDGIFDFGEETFSSGVYNGTLFRLPLRKVPTELSESVYDDQKIETLFHSFRMEAPMTLLFLKYLEEMTIYQRKIEDCDQSLALPRYRVKIGGTTAEDVRSKRQRFREKLLMVNMSTRDIQEDITCSLGVTICVQTYDKSQVLTQKEKSWFIVNLIKGEPMSSQLCELSKDESLSYSPYVGIATSYEKDEDFKGHVFCFLPLPLENTSLTGFPLHVNGFFALSQNRRHVKWPSADLSEAGVHSDKALLWNQCLISEVLSEVYISVIEQLIEKCEAEGNPDHLVSLVYNNIPDSDHVDGKWSVILDPLFESLLQKKFVFTHNSGGMWIRYYDAVFDSSSPLDEEVTNTLYEIMNLYNQNLVRVPCHIRRVIDKYRLLVTQLTPKFFSDLLRSNSCYENCSNEQKLHMLHFLISDGNTENVENLKLLPLESGDFVEFQYFGSDEVFVCSSDDARMFPGSERKLLKLNLPDTISQHIKNGVFQLQALDAASMAQLLQRTVNSHFLAKGHCMVWDTEASSVPGDWLQTVWTRLPNDSINYFTDIHIVPVEHSGYRHLYTLKSWIILHTHQHSTLPDAFSRSLERFCVTILPTLPDFMTHHPDVMKFIHSPTQDSVISLLTDLYHSESIHDFIKEFNREADPVERDSWRNFLFQCNIESDEVQNLLKQLQIFKDYESEQYTSVQEVNVLAPQLGYTLPVRFPCRLLTSTDSRQSRLAQNLGARHLTEELMMAKMLSDKWNSYSDSEKMEVMKLFIRKLYQFQQNDSLMVLAKNVRFVPTSNGRFQKPSDLYDPSNEYLKDLFADSSMFPDSPFLADDLLLGLRKLGLKSDQLTGEIILQYIQVLDRKARNEQITCVEEKQAKAVSHFLQQQPDLFFLKRNALNKYFLIVMDKPSSYPSFLPWYDSSTNICSPEECLLASIRNQRIVGSQIPLVSEDLYGNLKDAFQLLEPAVFHVLNHLFKLVHIYREEYKPDLLPCVNDIYTFLADNMEACMSKNVRDIFEKESIVWTGETFVEAKRVYVTGKKHDIDLKPYMYRLPGEFQLLKKLFLVMGAHERQSLEVLDEVQRQIKVKHDALENCSEDVGRDLNLIVQILNIYKLQPTAVNHLNILFPVYTGDNSKLHLIPATDCRYSNAEWLKNWVEEEDDEVVHYVHEDVPLNAAQLLGVPSLTEGLLVDTEAIEPCGQHEDLTGRIKGLLEGYTDGLSVPKEIVQNADDAGAKTVYFLYDERENHGARKRLIDENMKGFQGPALWAYNNAEFTQADLVNITKLGGATKEEDETKIGKFGLGFCSVYNLTDVPSFLTGNHLVIFDPHYKYLGSIIKGKEPGIKINLEKIQNQKLLKRIRDQFEPFNGVFGCDLSMKKGFTAFKGTLFRLPLRTPEQALNSEIRSTPYTKTDIRELLDMLMKSGGDLLLFSQNVTEIKLYHLKSESNNPCDACLVYSVTKNKKSSIPSSVNVDPDFSILKQVSKMRSKCQSDLGANVTRKVMFVDISVEIHDCEECLTTTREKKHSTTWMISYATGTSASLDLSRNIQAKGALPLAGIAIPVRVDGSLLQLILLEDVPFGFYSKGHYFSFLPMPIPHSAPVHINATFAVALDRMSIVWGTEDDKENLFKSQWNLGLLRDAVPNAYIALLESLKHFDMESDTEYLNIWPEGGIREQNTLQKAFLNRIIEENSVVFKRHSKWVGFQNCMFLDPYLVESKVGDIAIKAAIYFLDMERTIMNLTGKMEAYFKNAGLWDKVRERLLPMEEFFHIVLLNNIQSSYWKSKERNKLLLFALENIDETVQKLFQNSECIPSEPQGKLKKPSEMIHPKSSLVELFSKGDERLVHSEMAAELENYSGKKEDPLIRLGMMMDTLPDNLIIDRTKSVSEILFNCGACAADRSARIVSYIYGKQSIFKSHNNLKTQLANIPFLVVLQKPKGWIFNWKADSLKTSKLCLDEKTLPECNHSEPKTVHFASPVKLFLPSVQNLLGTQELFPDKSVYREIPIRDSFLSKLGIRGICKQEISTETVLAQLLDLGQMFYPSVVQNESVHLLSKICNDIYTFLDAKIRQQAPLSRNTSFSDLQEQPLILLGNRFLKPNQTALKIPVNCKPYLFGLQNHHLNTCPYLVRRLGIKDEFSVEDVLKVMLLEQKEKKDKPLLEDDLELTVRLIKVLVRSIDNSKYDASEFIKITSNMYEGEEFCLPDRNAILCPVSDLCMDESNIENMCTDEMKFVSEKIPPEHALKLGVKRKETQMFLNYSIPFGQRELLTTRINNILKGYPCNEGIMKELLQNADDAQATELHFITDFAQHPTEHLFCENWKPLQGPALLVYNDSSFSPMDIEGIQNLGIGSKREDRTKTGQYGVGFNAVYHLTDAPSFISKGHDIESGETMCIMDPCFKFLPQSTKRSPGIQLVNLNAQRASFPDVFNCYHEDHFLKDKGTVFRFPLRNEEHQDRQLSAPLRNEMLLDLISHFQNEMLTMLLFVHSVNKLSLSDITSGNLEKQYEVNVTLSQEDDEKRTKFEERVKYFNHEIKDGKDITSLESHTVSYQLTISDSRGFSNTWLVVQHIGFGKGSVSPAILSAYEKGELGLLPRGGVAFLLSSLPIEKKEYKAFCFLPLPVNTGLPVHVNGHFFLSGDTRSNLFNEDCGYRREWNNLLLTKVIPTAYVQGMEKLKEMFTDNKEELVRNILQVYNVFPMYGQCKDENWKLLAKSILQRILDEEHRLFHLTVDSADSTALEEKFVPMKTKEERFPAMINTLNETQKLLPRVMKRVGLWLLDTPLEVFVSMRDAGFDVQGVSPKHLVTFLKSFKAERGKHKCSITVQELGNLIEQTCLRTVQNVVDLLNYCKQSETFIADIVGLPLCLTDDGRLRIFQRRSGLFCSKHCSILPYSGKRFLHRRIVNILKEKGEIMCDLFRPFRIESFAKFLPENLPEDYNNQHSTLPWNPTSSEFPNKHWISDVWNFLKCQLEDKNDIKEGLTDVQSWCLVPCYVMKRHLNENSHDRNELKEPVLCPISALEKLIDIGITSSVTEVLLKLEIPVIDRSVLKQCMWLSSLLPSTQNPRLLLNCLYLNKNQTGFKQISQDDCFQIMLYFAEHIRKLTKNVNFKMKLKSLPLHITLCDERVTLAEHAHVLVLPSIIPKEGISTWSEKTGVSILKENVRLKQLYNSIGCTYDSVHSFYASHILPTRNCLPNEHFEKHLVFIKDYLFAQFRSTSVECKKLVTALQQLAIFDTGAGRLMKATELFSPFVPIMKAFLKPWQFPPEPFDERSWKEFMEMIGMKKEVPNLMIIKFALQIEKEALSGITETVRKNSELLLKYIWKENKTEEDLLLQISSISFIVPHQVRHELRSIFPQYGSEKLMAFKDSVPRKYKKCLWTTCCILPDSANPFVTGFRTEIAETVASRLGIVWKQPHLDKMIQHTLNVCERLASQLSEKLTKMCYGETFLTNLMSNIYKHMLKIKFDGHELKRRLGQKSIVYLPSENRFVSCECLVVVCTREIKPYLYWVPYQFHSHIPLFQILGTLQKASLNTYARVLEKLARRVGERELNPNELVTVKYAIEELFKCLEQSQQEKADQDVEILYIPNKKKILVSSEKLIHVDNKYLHSYTGIEESKCFLGFPELKLSVLDFQLLPQKWRPKLLSETVKRVLDRENLEVLEPNENIIHLQNFTWSHEFKEGLLRIHQVKINESSCEMTFHINAELLESNLQKIKIILVKELRENLVYEGRVVGCHEICSHVFHEHMDEDTEKWKFYTKCDGMEVTKWLSKIAKDFSQMIFDCTGIGLTSHGSLMLDILVNIDNLDEISSVLDKHEFPEYYVEGVPRESAFPQCGTCVEKKWFHVLDNSILMFESGEYVAVLSDDETSDSEESVYIYARVLEKIGSNRQGVLHQEFTEYKVDIGNGETDIKYAYEIYKFTRDETDASEHGPKSGGPGSESVFYERTGSQRSHQLDITPSVSQENTSEPKSMTLKEIFKNIREKLIAIKQLLDEDQRGKLLKRLCRQWHPDKNVGNESQATEVFKYIQQIWGKLERGECLNLEDDESEDVPSSSTSSQRSTQNNNFSGESSSFSNSRQKNFSNPSRYFNPGSSHDFFSNIFRQCNEERQRYESYRRTRNDSNSSRKRGSSRSTDFGYFDGTRSRPVSNRLASRKWLQQAKCDLDAAESCLVPMGSAKGYNWVCYLCHQAAEKALKSLLYMKDANKVTGSHDICGISSTINYPSLKVLASQLKNTTGDYTLMQYPKDEVPSSCYNNTHAETALRIASEIIIHVEAQL